MTSETITGNIIWLITVWGCAALFVGIGIYAIKRSKPMWFWSGSSVPSEKIKDIPAYNRENGFMWIFYSIPFWITGITYLWYPHISGILMGAYSILSLPLLVVVYYHIYNKYKV